MKIELLRDNFYELFLNSKILKVFLIIYKKMFY